MVIDDDGVDGMARVPHALERVEIGYSAIYRLKVRTVGLLHPNGVDERIGLQVELVYVMAVAHGQRETVGVDLPVDEYRIGAVGARGRNCKGVGQRGYRPHQFVVGINGVVERAVDRRAGRHDKCGHHKGQVACSLQRTQAGACRVRASVGHGKQYR